MDDETKRYIDDKFAALEAKANEASDRLAKAAESIDEIKSSIAATDRRADSTNRAVRVALGFEQVPEDREELKSLVAVLPALSTEPVPA